MWDENKVLFWRRTRINYNSLRLRWQRPHPLNRTLFALAANSQSFYVFVWIISWYVIGTATPEYGRRWNNLRFILVHLRLVLNGRVAYERTLICAAHSAFFYANTPPPLFTFTQTARSSRMLVEFACVSCLLFSPTIRFLSFPILRCA